MYKYILFLLLILIPCCGDAEEMIVAVVNKKMDALSQKVVYVFNDTSVKRNIANMHQKLLIVYGQDHPDYVRGMNVKYYPTLFRIEKQNGNWYLLDILDPIKTPVTIDSILHFLHLRLRKQQPQVELPPIQWPQPGGS